MRVPSSRHTRCFLSYLLPDLEQLRLQLISGNNNNNANNTDNTLCIVPTTRVRSSRFCRSVANMGESYFIVYSSENDANFGREGENPKATMTPPARVRRASRSLADYARVFGGVRAHQWKGRRTRTFPQFPCPGTAPRRTARQFKLVCVCSIARQKSSQILRVESILRVFIFKYL